MKDYFFSNQKRIQYKLLAGDLLLIVASILLSYSIRIFLDVGKPLSASTLFNRLHYLNVIFFLLHPMFLYIMGLYSPFQRARDFSNLFKMVGSIFLSGLIAAALLFFFPRFLIGRKVLLIHLPLLTVLLFLWRGWILSRNDSGNRNIGMGLIGSGSIISAFMEAAEKDPYSQFDIKCVCINDGEKDSCIRIGDGSLAIHDEVKTLLRQDSIQALAIDARQPLNNEEIQLIYDYRFKENKTVYDLTRLFESITGRVPVTYINQRWFLRNPIFQEAPRQTSLKIKRLFDLGLALFLLLSTSPLMLFAAVCIKLSSRGPVLYVQERVGMNRTPFKCYKFRTMIHNAEAECGPVFSKEKDDRVTLVGKVLRKTRLDELPQLFNILKGELSFVGPRPIRAYFADSFSKKVPFYEMRHNVKPGLTGWAQVHGCYAVPYGLEALEYELFYIQHMSMVLDFHILLKTLRTVFLGMGK